MLWGMAEGKPNLLLTQQHQEGFPSAPDKATLRGCAQVNSCCQWGRRPLYPDDYWSVLAELPVAALLGDSSRQSCPFPASRQLGLSLYQTRAAPRTSGSCFVQSRNVLATLQMTQFLLWVLQSLRPAWGCCYDRHSPETGQTIYVLNVCLRYLYPAFPVIKTAAQDVPQ